MLYTVCFVVRVFFAVAVLAISHVIMPRSSEDGSNREMETRGAAFELSHQQPIMPIEDRLFYRG